MPNEVINRAKYTARDFDTIFDDIRLFLEERYGDEYNDFQKSSQGVMIMDMIAYAQTQLHWYMDRRASEAYLDTCRLLSSASRITRQIGYRMAPASSSGVELTVAPEEPPPFDVPVKVGFKFRGPENLIFEAAEEVVFPAGSTDAQSISVREGETFRVTATSDGTPGQEVALPAADNEETFVIDGSVEVFVDGVLWQERDFISIGDVDEFEVHYHELPPVVRFGNGISGRIPDPSANIRVTYAVNHGRRGNVGRETINDAFAPLVHRFTTIDLDVINESPSTGGDDPETIEEARRNAPRWFGSRNKAITQEDYRILAGNFSSPEYGRIAAANAFVARSVSEDLEALGHINTALGEFDSYQTSIDNLCSNGLSSLDSLDGHAAVAGSQVQDIEGWAGDIEQAADDIVAASNAVLASSSLLDVAADALANMFTSGPWAYDIDDLINYFVGAGLPAYVDDLTNNWRPAILAATSAVSSAQASINAQGGIARSRAADARVDAQSIITTTSTGGALRSAVQAIVASSGHTRSIVLTIQGTVPPHRAAIEAAFNDLRAHLTEALGADCEANVITVPVLAFDGDGNYQSPSRALMNELERFLQANCDVAHVVNVVSGAPDLVPVSIDVRLAQSDAFVYSEVASEISLLLANELRARRFGADLYLNRAYALAESVVGSENFDLSFSTDADYLDSAGNVVVPDSKVIVNGGITITPLSI